jgi:hypothetical protein
MSPDDLKALRTAIASSIASTVDSFVKKTSLDPRLGEINTALEGAVGDVGESLGFSRWRAKGIGEEVYLVVHRPESGRSAGPLAVMASEAAAESAIVDLDDTGDFDAAALGIERWKVGEVLQREE